MTAHALAGAREGRTAAPGGDDDSPAVVRLSSRRLNVLRVGYAFLGGGLVVVKWPILIGDARHLPVANGVVTSLLCALSVFALLGLRFPVRMLPILLFEVGWKVLWLGAIATPRLLADDIGSAFTDVLINCSFVVVVIAVIPWRYVAAQMTAPGDRWREPR